MLRRTIAVASVTIVLSSLTPIDSEATAQRTFVASNGNDANPCTLTLPCRAFAAAIAQTISGGEVVVLDSAGYGPVTITQSVSIVAAPGVYAGISVPANQTGVAITGPGVNVVLRGLAINSTAGTGYGIRMVAAGYLSVESCEVSNFSNNGIGVSIENVGMARIVNAIVANNYIGVLAGFGANLTVANSQVVQNVSQGIVLNGATSGETTQIHITDTLISSTSYYLTQCIENATSPGAFGHISATRVTVVHCEYGVINKPIGSGTTTISNSMVTDNSYGFYQASGTFFSLGNSHVRGNSMNTFGPISTVGGT